MQLSFDQSFRVSGSCIVYYGLRVQVLGFKVRDVGLVLKVTGLMQFQFRLHVSILMFRLQGSGFEFKV